MKFYCHRVLRNIIKPKELYILYTRQEKKNGVCGFGLPLRFLQKSEPRIPQHAAPVVCLIGEKINK